MKVKDLMEFLKLQPPNRQIILQKDGEGNGYSPLAGADLCHYQADSTYSGEVLEEGRTNAIVLFPVN